MKSVQRAIVHVRPCPVQRIITHPLALAPMGAGKSRHIAAAEALVAGAAAAGAMEGAAGADMRRRTVALPSAVTSNIEICHRCRRFSLNDPQGRSQALPL